MKLKIVAVGRQRRSPEADLIEDYIDRFNKAGRQFGFNGLTVIEVEDTIGRGKLGEGNALMKAIPDGAYAIAMDERGNAMTSPTFASRLKSLRDRNLPDVCFIIGGAEGLDSGVLARADERLSLGSMVWPHMLARVMIAEQLYRAATILAGSPYHKS